MVCNLSIIPNMYCAACIAIAYTVSSQIILITEIGGPVFMVYLVCQFDLTVIGTPMHIRCAHPTEARWTSKA